MEKLDLLVADHIEHRLLLSSRLEKILSSVLDRREERSERQATHFAELRKRTFEADGKLDAQRILPPRERFGPMIQGGPKSLGYRARTRQPTQSIPTKPHSRSAPRAELFGFWTAEIFGSNCSNCRSARFLVSDVGSDLVPGRRVSS